MRVNPRGFGDLGESRTWKYRNLGTTGTPNREYPVGVKISGIYHRGQGPGRIYVFDILNFLTPRLRLVGWLEDFSLERKLDSKDFTNLQHHILDLGTGYRRIRL